MFAAHGGLGAGPGPRTIINISIQGKSRPRAGGALWIAVSGLACEALEPSTQRCRSVVEGKSSIVLELSFFLQAVPTSSSVADSLDLTMPASEKDQNEALSVPSACGSSRVCSCKAMDVCRQAIGRRCIFWAVDSDRFSHMDALFALVRSKTYAYGVDCLTVNGR